MAGKLQWLGITLLASVVGLLSGTLPAYQLLKVPLQHLSLTTPGFVMDRARLIRALPSNATPEQIAQAVEDFAEFVRNSEVKQYRALDARRISASLSIVERFVTGLQNPVPLRYNVNKGDTKTIR